MKFLSTRELRNRPCVRTLFRKDDLVLTATGKRIATFLGVDELSLGFPLQSGSLADSTPHQLEIEYFGAMLWVFGVGQSGLGRSRSISQWKHSLHPCSWCS